jgi:hypothetical protein
MTSRSIPPANPTAGVEGPPRNAEVLHGTSQEIAGVVRIGLGGVLPKECPVLLP